MANTEIKWKTSRGKGKMIFRTAYFPTAFLLYVTYIKIIYAAPFSSHFDL
jgi:hypothetical protein